MEDKLKLLLIAESMGGGLRKHVVQLIEKLDTSKFDIYLIHGTDSLDGVFLKEYDRLSENCQMFPCEYLTREIDFLMDFRSLKFIWKVINKIEPDIVHCHSSKAGAIGRIASKMKKVPKIYYTPHAYSFLSPDFGKFKKSVFIIIERLLGRYATTCTFSVSEGEKKEALNNKITIQDKIMVIYNGIPDTELANRIELKKELGLFPDSYVIGNNARISEQKNPRLFVDIAKKVVNKNKNIHFVWIGDGPLEEEIKIYIDQCGLSENVHLLGFKRNSEFLVGAYNLFLITSNYEGLPYAPIEALRAGVPVLATYTTGNNEIVNNKVNGMLFDIGNVDLASNIILDASNNKFNITSDTVKDSFKSRFSEEKMIETISYVYCR